MRQRTARIGTIVALGLLAAGCGGDGEDTSVTAQEPGFSAFAASLSPCPEEGSGDGPAPASILSTPGSWYRLHSAEARVAESSADPSVIVADAEYVGGDASAAEAGRGRAAEGAEFYASALTTELVAQAVADGAKTYLKVGDDEGTEPPVILFPLAFDEAGDYAFVGECRAQEFGIPLSEEFGDRSTEVARSIVGADASTTTSLLDLDADTTVPELPVAPPLDPQFTDPEVLAQLAVADFTLAPVPEGWVGPYTICPKIEAGFSGCFALDAVETHGVPAMMYYDPADPVVEFWLADAAADLTAPIAKVGSIDLTETLQGFRGIGVVDVTLSLPTDVGVEDVVARPDAAVPDVVLDARVKGG